jgi:uncharacterized protein YraI
MRKAALTVTTFIMLTLSAAILLGQPAAAAPMSQAATPTLPAERVEIFQDVNVRSGPGTEYDQVGVLVPGQTSAILGQSPDSTWIKIEYIGGPDNTGWVFGSFVRIIGDNANIPTLIPPATPTLRPTTTPEPGATSGPLPIGTQVTGDGRLPTFTPPAVQSRPTLLPAQGVREGAAFPPAVLIIVLFVLGSFGGILSLLRFRR